MIRALLRESGWWNESYLCSQFPERSVIKLGSHADAHLLQFLAHGALGIGVVMHATAALTPGWE